MQPSLQPSPNPNSNNLASQNNNEASAKHLVPGGGLTLQHNRRTIDTRSPLSEGIQALPWPNEYKPITLPKFNGRTDPHQFLMSFEAAVASARGNDTVLSKSFVIAAEGDALAWPSMLKPSIIYSWENL
jgi:hypothetical protein